MSPKPQQPEITIVVDGVEIPARQGAMLVDAAKQGDVEIPVFCYEPKLGAPVGACRMCLVEIEGVPKLQTACSTPVRDGMVIYTQTGRVKEAQSAVVEFLLVNHPLDCPVCDKGGECPLQDISMGWGPGRSRVTDPKRHFRKPIPLSPLVRIDRERCILCYRCVRFSQEVSEDDQLHLLERGAATYVGTFDDRPYVAPFHGNIIELCPVGALTSEAYRFRARPWDIEDAGTICTLCPSQCNIKLTVRDERVMRVLGRDNATVDDGWLCDKGRFGFQMIEGEDRITAPMLNRGGVLTEVSWEEAIATAAAGLRTAAEGKGVAAIAGGQTSNEEGWLAQRLMRETFGSRDLASSPYPALSGETLRALADPGLSVGVSAIDTADAVLVLGCDPMHEMPIVDLRLRKAIRRTTLAVVVASDRPTALDGGSEETARYAPGAELEFIRALAGSARGSHADGEIGEDAERIASVLGRQSNVIVLWSSRICRGPDGEEIAQALVDLAHALGLEDEAGSGMIEVPAEANGRGLREVGFGSTAGPGLAEVTAGRDGPTIRAALAAGELDGLLVLNSDPVRDHPRGDEWEQALSHPFIVAFAAFPNATTKHADVVFPAETHAEKDGTVTHPDGRLQRMRPGVPHPNRTRMGWQVLVELAAALGDETGLMTGPQVLGALADDVSLYSGITHEEIGGGGVRWQERRVAHEAATVAPSREANDRAAEGSSDEGRMRSDLASREGAPATTSGRGELKLGVYRDLWAAEVTDRSPSLKFLAPRQTLEISPSDAEGIGVGDGDEVVVRSNGSSVAARAALRDRVRPGSVFLIDGLAKDGANRLHAEPGTAVEVERADHG